MGLFFVGQIGKDLHQMMLPAGFDVLCVYKCSNLNCENWASELREPEFFHLYNSADVGRLQLPESAWMEGTVYSPPGIEVHGDWAEPGSVAVEVGYPYSLAVGAEVIDYPGWEENPSWREIDDEPLHAYIDQYPVRGAKLLGHPRWEQAPRYPRCDCGRRMKQLLQIEEPFVHLGDGGRLYVFHCPDWCNRSSSLAVVWDCG